MMALNRMRACDGIGKKARYFETENRPGVEAAFVAAMAERGLHPAQPLVIGKVHWFTVETNIPSGWCRLDRVGEFWFGEAGDVATRLKLKKTYVDCQGRVQELQDPKQEA